MSLLVSGCTFTWPAALVDIFELILRMLALHKNKSCNAKCGQIMSTCGTLACRGSTNTEPGAVATGSATQYSGK